MGIVKGLARGAWGLTKVTARVGAKTVVVTAKVATVATKAVAKTTYDHRKQIGKAGAIAGKATLATGRLAAKGVSKTAQVAYDHRREIGGAIAGVSKGTAAVVTGAANQVLITDADFQREAMHVRAQGTRYRRLVAELGAKDASRRFAKNELLDTLVVGGSVLADYVSGAVAVPLDIQTAFELTYPQLAARESFAHAVARMDSSELQGFVSAVKGKLFEIEYADYLNDGNLPAGYHASLAPTANQPGWDIKVVGHDGTTAELLQLKATQSVGYVKKALERYPNIDVVTTEEVHSHLLLQGIADDVHTSVLSNAELQAAVEHATVQGEGAVMHWTPPVLSLALIAFSSYVQTDLDASPRTKQFGERATKSYLTYLFGGAIAVATSTWWVGALTGMGSRFVVARGNAKRVRLTSLREVVRSNERVLKELAKLAERRRAWGTERTR